MAVDAGTLGDLPDASAGSVLETLDHRSTGPIFAALGLIASMPVIGGIPGISIALGLLILAVAGQALVTGPTLWAPGFVRRRKFGADRFDRRWRRCARRRTGSTVISRRGRPSSSRGRCGGASPSW